MKKLTKKQAKEYSLIKWKYASETGCTPGELKRWIRKNHPEIDNLYMECGFCQYYIRNKDKTCKACPLDKECDWGSWYEWAYSKEKRDRQYYATQLYKFIKGVK